MFPETGFQFEQVGAWQLGGRRLFRLVAPTVTLILAAGAVGQTTLPMPLSSREVAVSVDSGFVENTGSVTTVAYSAEIHVADAVWLRLRFDELILPGDLTAATESRLVITSSADGASQTLDARTVRQWRNTSAYFNGDRVRIELMVHPGTDPSRVVISRVTAGLPAGPLPRAICGGSDDRLPSSDPRVARVLPAGCTAFIIDDANHCMITAGHCAELSDVELLEFNVPLSDPAGNIVHPPPEDQYMVDPASLQFSSPSSLGDDWTYFGCFSNSNTGLTAFEAQGEFFRLASSIPPPAGQLMRLTGFGVNDPGAMSPPEWNQAQRTATGPRRVPLFPALEFFIDATGGNSGSAVGDEESDEVWGIMTHSGCILACCGNWGTPVDNAGLQNALANPLGVCVATVNCAAVLNGDLNQDGLVNGRDIPLFVLTLVTGGTPNTVEFCAADIDDDGVLEPIEDLVLFVGCLLAGACP